MQANFRKSYSLVRPVSFLYIIFFIAACSSNSNKNNPALKHQLNKIDSLIIAGKGDSAVNVLIKLRPQINKADPLIAEYYRLRAEQFRGNIASMQLYADSALAFFSNKTTAQKYKKLYFATLLTKADACMLAGGYNQAMHYYDKAKLLIESGGCDDGILAIKIAGIYFAQKNYALAAKYWAKSYPRIGVCDPSFTRQKLFFIRQSSLNNAGVAFERLGQLDSAALYYVKDIALIQQADKENILTKYYINVSSLIVYDNLGGLYIKKGDYVKAYQYLNKCLSIPTVDVDGARITSFLKMAELYFKTGRYTEAATAFGKSRALLNRFWKDNPESLLNWNKLYAAFLFKTKQPGKAYLYLETYVRLSDSLQNNSSKIFRLDIDRELNTLQQQQAMSRLREQDKLKLIYLVALTVVAILLTIIMIMVSRSLKRSRKNHRSTVAYAEQLKSTFAELESANKNYIRMMRVMAHDLRNPLWGITGLATMLLDEEEKLSDDSRQALKLIESTGSNTMDMINELLKSGLDDENEAIVVEETDLKKLLFDSVELLRFKAKAKKQEIVFNADDTPVIAHVNVEKMWRVFNNVIVNAIKFSFEGAAITVGIQQDDKHILISVADKGIGIPEKNRDSIFEMFTPNKRQGTGGEQPFGLGLSITKKIMENHGGKVWFSSEVGKGTVFYLQLERNENL